MATFGNPPVSSAPKWPIIGKSNRVFWKWFFFARFFLGTESLSSARFCQTQSRAKIIGNLRTRLPKSNSSALKIRFLPKGSRIVFQLSGTRPVSFKEQTPPIAIFQEIIVIASLMKEQESLIKLLKNIRTYDFLAKGGLCQGLRHEIPMTTWQFPRFFFHPLRRLQSYGYRFNPTLDWLLCCGVIVWCSRGFSSLQKKNRPSLKSVKKERMKKVKKKTNFTNPLFEGSKQNTMFDLQLRPFFRSEKSGLVSRSTFFQPLVWQVPSMVTIMTGQPSPPTRTPNILPSEVRN